MGGLRDPGRCAIGICCEPLRTHVQNIRPLEVNRDDLLGLIRLLLKHGADMNANKSESPRGTPWMIAMKLDMRKKDSKLLELFDEFQCHDWEEGYRPEDEWMELDKCWNVDEDEDEYWGNKWDQDEDEDWDSDGYDSFDEFFYPFDEFLDPFDDFFDPYFDFLF